ncbi:coiled-coil domain-containing protein [Zobellella maritima]|uniref:hypothetical protein n=1 Tax=Zobellella maritima TaxID=2059725 RepID=UPI0018E51966|nr:hypothetical protein [Zobellella maritima]
MPGLKIQQIIDVKTRTLASLLSDIQMAEKGNNLLIIDAPGAEQLIADQLAQLGRHNPFAHVLLYCPSEPHYSSNSSSADVLDSLYQQGYELTIIDRSDPDRPLFQLNRNALKLELDAANRALLQQQMINRDLQQTLTGQTRQLATTGNTLTELQQRLEITGKINRELRLAFSAIQTEHKKQLADLQQRLDATHHTSSELAQQLAITEQANADWQQALADSRTEHEQQQAELQRQLDETRQANIELTQQLAITEQINADWQQAQADSRTDHEQQQAELQRQLDETRQTKDELTLQLAMAEQANADLQQRLDAVHYTNSELAQQLAITEQINADWQQALADSRTDHEQQQAALQRQLNEMSQAKDELTQQLAMAEQANADLQQRLDAVHHTNSELAQQLAITEQTNADWQHTLADSRTDHEQQQAELQRQLNETRQAKDQLTQQLAMTEQANADLQQRLDAVHHTNSELEQQLAANRQDSAVVKNERDSAREECNALRQTLTIQEKALISNKDMLGWFESNRQITERLEEKTRKIVADQILEVTKSLAGLKNHISSGLVNAAKQIECFIGIQNYLDKGSTPFNFHGWPISPDLGLYLVGLIDANDYDCIIEFGSGTSTLLMAKTLQIKQEIQKNHEKLKTKNKKQQDNQGQHKPLPHIVSFEHDRLYHQKTASLLADNSIEHLVDLVHAPLVNYQYNEDQQFSYYDCQEKMNELTARFKDKKANILVLVDGPPGSTNTNARFPALPHLTHSLPEHKMTLVMDDYNRPEEKEIIELWKRMAAESSINVKIEVIDTEKGLATFSVL